MSGILRAFNRKGTLMPHFKCAACRIRVRAGQRPVVSVLDRCPQCASLLEPVDDLAAVIGFRSIASVDGAMTALEVGGDERIAQRVGDLGSHRARRLSREPTDNNSTTAFDDLTATAMAVSIAVSDR